MTQEVLYFLLFFAEAPKSDTLKTTVTIVKYTTDPVAIFFGILSAFLIIVPLVFASLYLYRKYKAKLSTLSIRYFHRQDEDKVTFADKEGDRNSNLTLENPLYGADPTMVTTHETPQENGTNPFTNTDTTDMK